MIGERKAERTRAGRPFYAARPIPRWLATLPRWLAPLGIYGQRALRLGRPALPTTGWGAKEMCHSTKRTHFGFHQFTMEEIYLQGVVRFAERFANGFVSENEAILSALARPLWCWGALNL